MSKSDVVTILVDDSLALPSKYGYEMELTRSFIARIYPDGGRATLVCTTCNRELRAGDSIVFDNDGTIMHRVKEIKESG